MSFQFTSESVSAGHPDKVADQISDAILDNLLAFDPFSKVAIETLVCNNRVVLAGEKKSRASVDFEAIVRDKINEIGYLNKDQFGGFTGNDCEIIQFVQEQSIELENPDFAPVAGDQGIMFGYATSETDRLMPLPIYLANVILESLSDLRKQGVLPCLGPDAKSQVTLEYDDDHNPKRIHTILLSTLHSPEVGLNQLREELKNKLFPAVKDRLSDEIKSYFHSDTIYQINPMGKFNIGGPNADTGLTGRKIIVDTYGGKGAHGGGAFSGKDPTKVDRSATYIARYIARTLVEAKVAEKVLVQLSYIIGKPNPSSVYINTYNTINKSLIDRGINDGELANIVGFTFPLSVNDIINFLGLRNPIFSETSFFGHMGRLPQRVNKQFSNSTGESCQHNVELFTWEKSKHVDAIKQQLF